MKNCKYIIEVPASGNKGWFGGAWCMVFVYSNKGNFILKGYRAEVMEYLNKLKSKGYKYFANVTMFSKDYIKRRSAVRNTWIFHNKEYTIINPRKKNRKTWSKYEFYKYGHGTICEFKRLPNRWVPEIFEDLID